MNCWPPNFAPEHDGVEAGRVEDAADVPGRAGDHVEVVGEVLDELDEQQRDDDDQRPGRGRPAAGIAGRLTIAASMPTACSTDSARKSSQPRQTRWNVATIRRPFQQARSTGSVGSIRSQPGLGEPVADQEQALVDAPEHERPGRAVPEAAEDHRQHQVAVGPQRAAAAAAQRDVEVVAQPVREADVPAVPEVLAGWWRSRGG